MNVHVNLSRLIVVGALFIVIGCAPAQLMPQFDDTTLRTKQRDISNHAKRIPRQITEDPNAILSRIYDRLEPPASQICIANGERWLKSSCSNWKVLVIDDENFNAYATPNHEIIFTTEVFKYTRSDDELAFILAHEMGHHILNHSMEDRVNAEIMGASVGILSAILMGAISEGLGIDEEVTAEIVEDAMEDGWESGRESGRLTYSIDQESEADKLALRLVKMSGYSENEARRIMLHIHGDSGTADLRSAHKATHPTGPERLAAFDLYASNKYAGVYKYGTPNGQRTFIYANGEKYVGEWKDGKRDGQGTYTYASGAKYVGKYKDGERNGQGTYTFADGEKYVGEWKDSKRNGQGTDTYANGEKYVGEFKAGSKNGQGTYTSADGSVKEGIWKDGNFLGTLPEAERAEGARIIKEEQEAQACNSSACLSSGTRLPRTPKHTYSTLHVGDDNKGSMDQIDLLYKDTDPSVKDGVYAIPELGISVRDYDGSVSVSLSLNFSGSQQAVNKGGVVVVSVEQDGKASKLGIKENYRIVSYTYKGITSSSFPFSNAQELKDVAKNNGTGYFTNFVVMKDERGPPEWSKLCWFLC